MVRRVLVGLSLMAMVFLVCRSALCDVATGTAKLGGGAGTQAAGNDPVEAKATEMTDEEAVGKLVSLLRAGLPAGWKVESEAGEFTPRYWTKAGKGVEIRVTEPVVPGARRSKGVGPMVWRYWLMAPGYDGEPGKPGPHGEVPQKNPAVEWGLWRGRQVICEEAPIGELQQALAKVLAATESVANCEAGNFQTFVSQFRQTATGTMRWVEEVNRVQHFTPLTGTQGDLLWLTSWPERERPNGMYIWIMRAGFKGMPEKMDGGEQIKFVMNWNGRPVYVSGRARDKALEEVKEALRATEKKMREPETTMPASKVRAASRTVEEDRADYQRLCAIWRKTEPEAGKSKEEVTAKERAVLLEEVGGRRDCYFAHDFRRMAAITLGNLREKEAVGKLIERLGDAKEEGMVRAEAARALGRTGDKRAVGPLLEVLLAARGEEDSLWIKLYAGDALRAIAPAAEDLKGMATVERFAAGVALIGHMRLPESEREWLESDSTVSNKPFWKAKEIDAICLGLELVKPDDLPEANRNEAAKIASKLLGCGFPVDAFDAVNFPDLARFCREYQPKMFAVRTKGLRGAAARRAETKEGRR